MYLKYSLLHLLNSKKHNKHIHSLHLQGLFLLALLHAKGDAIPKNKQIQKKQCNFTNLT